MYISNRIENTSLSAKQVLTLNEAFQMISSTEQKTSSSFFYEIVVHSRRGLKILSRMFDTSSDVMFEKEMEKQKRLLSLDT